MFFLVGCCVSIKKKLRESKVVFVLRLFLFVFAFVLLVFFYFVFVLAVVFSGPLCVSVKKTLRKD
jgi:hypothetical protein